MPFNFRRVKLLQIENFRTFCVFIFVVTLDLLPIWSKFLQDETFADGYCIIRENRESLTPCTLRRIQYISFRFSIQAKSESEGSLQ